MISRAVGCLVAILVAIFAMPSPGSAVPEISVTTTYAYDSPVYDAPGNDSVQERGPPSVSIANTTYDAIGHWSRRTAARPDGAGARPTITYAYPGTVVWVARSTTTTSSDVVLSDGDLLSVPAIRVAAETGPRTLDIGGGSFPGIVPQSVVRTPDGVVSVNPNIAHGPSVVGRSQQLPFADNSFTNVTMNHFPGDQFGGGTLSEVGRVLRPGGTLSLTTGRRADVTSILSELQQLGFSTQLRRAEGGIPWISGTLG